MLVCMNSSQIQTLLFQKWCHTKRLNPGAKLHNANYTANVHINRLNSGAKLNSCKKVNRECMHKQSFQSKLRYYDGAALLLVELKSQMSSSANKRQLSTSSMPSPLVRKPIKMPKMQDTQHNISPIGFNTDTFKKTEKSNQTQGDNNCFQLVFGYLEEKVMSMADYTEKWHFMVSALKTVAKKFEIISTLEKSNNEMKYSLQSARGKITRLENDLEQAQKKVLDLESASLQKNAVYNLEEKPQEDSIKVINDFLEQELKIKARPFE